MQTIHVSSLFILHASKQMQQEIHSAAISGCWLYIHTRTRRYNSVFPFFQMALGKCKVQRVGGREHCSYTTRLVSQHLSFSRPIHEQT